MNDTVIRFVLLMNDDSSRFKEDIEISKSENVWLYKNTQKYPVGVINFIPGIIFVAGAFYDFLKMKVCDSPFLNVIRCTLPS